MNLYMWSLDRLTDMVGEGDKRVIQAIVGSHGPTGMEIDLPWSRGRSFCVAEGEIYQDGTSAGDG